MLKAMRSTNGPRPTTLRKNQIKSEDEEDEAPDAKEELRSTARPLQAQNADAMRTTTEDAEDVDDDRDDDGGENKLDDRPGDLGDELLPERVLQREELFEFTQCFGKRTRLFRNSPDGQVEWREVLLLVFEGIEEAIPLVHAVGHPLGNRLDGSRSRLRLVLHHLRQRQPRFQHVTQRPAMFNQGRQGNTR